MDKERICYFGILVCLLANCVCDSIQQIYIDTENSEKDEPGIYILEHPFTQPKQLQVFGDVYILETLTSNNREAVQNLLVSAMRTKDHIVVKVAGYALSIVTEEAEISSLVTRSATQRNCSIVEDIKQILQVSVGRPHIYVITDYGCGETPENDIVFELLKEREIQIDILHLYSHTNGLRQRRQINFYQLLANISGGSVIQTDKQNIGSALNVLKQTIKTATIHIMRFADHSPPGADFKIPVDDTMQELIFKATVERSNPVMIATTPSGMPAPARPQLLGKASAGTVIGLLEVNLTKPSDYGTWKISRLDGNLWDIVVDGQSPIDFTHEFLEPGAGGFGEYPINGRPIAGKTYKTMFTVPEFAKVKTVRAGMLFSRDKPMPIVMETLTNVGGRRGQAMFYANLTIPKENFMLGIEGSDNTGHTYRRIDPILITPMGLTLIVPSLTGIKFYQNETLTIPFTVVNEVNADQDVDVKIEDDKHFALPPNIISAKIQPGQNYSGQFVIQAGLTVGETTTVTITAKPYVPGQFSYGQYEIRRFTVLDKNITTTTLSTPTTTTPSTTTDSTSTSTPTPTTTATIPTTSASTTVASTVTVSTVVSTTVQKQTTAGSSANQPLSSSQASSQVTTPTTGSPQSTLSSTATQGLSTTASASVKQSSAATTLAPSSTAQPGAQITNAPATSIQTTPSSAPPAAGNVQTTTTLQAKASVTPSTLPSSTSAATQTAAPAASDKENTSDNKNNLAVASITAGIAVGGVIAVAAIGTMALLFRNAMSKIGKTAPLNKQRKSSRPETGVAWS